MNQPFRIASIVLLIINGLTAIAGGICLILDPSGHLIHISTDWLAKTPFENYLVPGLVLSLAIGFFSIYAALLFITDHKHAPAYLFLEGIFLSAWTLIQVLTFSKLSFLQPVYGFAGISMLLLGFILIIRVRLQGDLS